RRGGARVCTPRCRAHRPCARRTSSRARSAAATVLATGTPPGGSAKTIGGQRKATGREGPRGLARGAAIPKMHQSENASARERLHSSCPCPTRFHQEPQNKTRRRPGPGGSKWDRLG